MPRTISQQITERSVAIVLAAAAICLILVSALMDALRHCYQDNERTVEVWLAQQCRWPPALPGFPANWEFYREFCKIAASGAPETAK